MRAIVTAADIATAAATDTATATATDTDIDIEPAERESRRAPRGKLARPCFWTCDETTPRCSILGGPIGTQICIQIVFVFLVIVTLGGCRFASF